MLRFFVHLLSSLSSFRTHKYSTVHLYSDRDTWAGLAEPGLLFLLNSLFKQKVWFSESESGRHNMRRTAKDWHKKIGFTPKKLNNCSLLQGLIYVVIMGVWPEIRADLDVLNLLLQKDTTTWCYRYRDWQLVPGPFSPVKVSVYKYVKPYYKSVSFLVVNSNQNL